MPLTTILVIIDLFSILCDTDLWPPNFNQVILQSNWMFLPDVMKFPLGIPDISYSEQSWPSNMKRSNHLSFESKWMFVPNLKEILSRWSWDITLGKTIKYYARPPSLLATKTSEFILEISLSQGKEICVMTVSLSPWSLTEIELIHPRVQVNFYTKFKDISLRFLEIS